jgi:hypothetical protein
MFRAAPHLLDAPHPPDAPFAGKTLTLLYSRSPGVRG